MILTILLSVTLLIIISYLDLKNKQKFMRKLGNVESYYLPILGSIFCFFPKGIVYVYDWLRSEEPSRLLWIFSIPVLYTRNPEEIQIILLNKNSLAKSILYKYVEPLRESLIAINVESWRPRRRAMNKCFRRKQILEFTPQYNEFSKFGMEKLLPKMQVKDLGEIFMCSNLNLFYGTLGGFDTNFNSIIQFNIVEAVLCFEKIFVERFFSLWFYLDVFLLKTGVGKRYEKMMNSIKESGTRVYEFMEKKHSVRGANNRHDVLNILMENYQSKETKSEMNLFSVAAEHTTGTVITACLLLLGMHQDVQEKVYQEVRDVVGADGQVEIEHLSKLKYTFMVVQETLRLFPPIQVIGRQVDEDIYLGDDKYIPKGTQIMLSLKELHRDGKLWKNPLEFNPERFSPKEVEKRHPCCFLPFSYGSRNCIGFKFAETVMKIFVANIVREYHISSNCGNVADIEIPNAVMLPLPDNLEVRFQKR